MGLPHEIRVQIISHAIHYNTIQIKEDSTVRQQSESPLCLVPDLSLLSLNSAIRSEVRSLFKPRCVYYACKPTAECWFRAFSEFGFDEMWVLSKPHLCRTNYQNFTMFSFGGVKFAGQDWWEETFAKCSVEGSAATSAPASTRKVPWMVWMRMR